MAQIQLKRKYLTGQQYKSQKSASGHSGNKGRHKISQKEKERLPPQPKMVMVVTPGNRTRMIRVG